MSLKKEFGIFRRRIDIAVNIASLIGCSILVFVTVNHPTGNWIAPTLFAAGQITITMIQLIFTRTRILRMNVTPLNWTVVIPIATLTASAYLTYTFIDGCPPPFIYDELPPS